MSRWSLDPWEFSRTDERLGREESNMSQISRYVHPTDRDRGVVAYSADVKRCACGCGIQTNTVFRSLDNDRLYLAIDQDHCDIAADTGGTPLYNGIYTHRR